MPLPSQSQFQAVKARFKGFSGPVGSGKSAALCLEAIRQAFVNRGRQGLLAAPTFGMLRDATLTSLFRAMEEQEVDFEHRKSDGELTIKGAGSTVLLRSLEEPERLRGTNLAWFGIDELSYTREEAWLRLEARLRDPKADEVVRVWQRGHRRDLIGFISASCISRFRVMTACARSHLKTDICWTGRRITTNGWKAAMIRSFIEQEALGEYLNSRADRVYHCFNAAVHLVRQAYDPKKTLLWALDFNVAPMSSVLVQEHNGRLVVIDEIVLDRATTEEAGLEFENRYRNHGAGLEIFGDASGRNMHTTGTTDYTMLQGFLYRAGFRKVKLRVPQRNPPVLSRVQKVNALLTNALGEVRLEVDPRCKELIKDFEQVMFKPDSGVIDKLRDLRRTHASDALGYLVWALFGEKTVVGEINRPLFLARDRVDKQEETR